MKLLAICGGKHSFCVVVYRIKRFILPNVITPWIPPYKFVRLPNKERNPIIKPPVLKSEQQQQVDVLKNLIVNFNEKLTPKQKPFSKATINNVDNN